MPPLNLKWHNLSLALRIKVSPDAKALLYVICIFILLGWGSVSKSVESKFDAASIALGAALCIGLYKDYKADKMDVDVAKDSLGPRVAEIKAAAAGIAQPPKPSPEVPNDK